MSDAVGNRQRHWKESVPADRAWKPKPGLRKRARAAEQDRAAGGPQMRAVSIGEGRFARGSIALRLYKKQRRIRAYLRWSQEGGTRERYVGEVDEPTRAANLKRAWEVAHAAGYAEPESLPPESRATSPASRSVMRANKGRDTKPELLLRSALHREGLRYRVGTRPLADLRRTADVVFSKARVAVFVDGCFWHGCPAHHRAASKRASFWEEKIAGNRERDAETTAALQQHGWVVMRFWEHDDPVEAAERVSKVVRGRLNQD